MEWPWPPHLLAESSFSKEIRKMLQPSITDFLSVENSNSSSFQLGQISRIQGKEIPSACIHLDWSLQSIILLYEGSFGWKCLSTWLAKKKKLILMELEYFGFLVFILPSKQKTSPADPTTCTLRHKYSNAKCQSLIYTHTLVPTDAHSPDLTAWKQAQGFQIQPQHLSDAKKNKYIKLQIDWTMDVFIMGKGLITLPEFCNPNGKAKHGCYYCHTLHNSTALTNNNSNKKIK